MRRYVRRATLNILVLVASLATTTAGAVVLFIGPKGSPDASGPSCDSPLPDLQTTVDKGLQAGGTEERLEVRVLGGTYVGQQLRIATGKGRQSGIEISSDNARVRPVFDGGGTNPR